MFIRQDCPLARNQYPAGPIKHSNVRISDRWFNIQARNQSASKAGLNFQANLVAALEMTYANTDWVVIPDFWFQYDNYKGESHYAGPDIIMLNVRLGKLIVIECKLSNTDAYKQTFLYMSLLQSYFPKEHWDVHGFIYFNRDRDTHYSGPVEYWLDSLVNLDYFKWDAKSLPLLGILSTDFVGVPIWG